MRIRSQGDLSRYFSPSHAIIRKLQHSACTIEERFPRWMTFSVDISLASVFYDTRPFGLPISLGILRSKRFRISRRGGNQNVASPENLRQKRHRLSMWSAVDRLSRARHTVLGFSGSAFAMFALCCTIFLYISDFNEVQNIGFIQVITPLAWSSLPSFISKKIPFFFSSRKESK